MENVSLKRYKTRALIKTDLLSADISGTKSNRFEMVLVWAWEACSSRVCYPGLDGAALQCEVLKVKLTGNEG